MDHASSSSTFASAPVVVDAVVAVAPAAAKEENPNTGQSDMDHSQVQQELSIKELKRKENMRKDIEVYRAYLGEVPQLILRKIKEKKFQCTFCAKGHRTPVTKDLHEQICQRNPNNKGKAFWELSKIRSFGTLQRGFAGGGGGSQVTKEVQNLVSRIESLERQWDKYFAIPPETSKSPAQAPTTATCAVDKVQHWALLPMLKMEPTGVTVKPDDVVMADPLLVDAQSSQDATSKSASKSKRRGGLKCPSCTEILGYRSALKAHLFQVHDFKQKLYKCWSCRVFFLTKDELKNHIEKFHSLKCGFCYRRAFHGPSGLENHVKHVHGFDSRTCPACDMDVYQLSHGAFVAHVKEHKKTSGKELVLRCSVCRKPKFFANAEQKAKHEFKYHSIPLLVKK